VEFVSPKKEEDVEKNTLGGKKVKRNNSSKTIIVKTH
jgi:hypothetical protein